MSGQLLLIAVLQVLTILVGFARLKSLALLLGPGQFGVVGTIDQVVVSALTLGAFATPFTALKFMARSHSENDVAFQRSGSGFLRLMTALGLITTAIASALLAWRPQLFGADLASYETPLRIAILGVPSALLLMLFVNALAAMRRPVAAAVATLLSAAVLAAGAIAGAWWRGIVGVYSLSVTAAVISTVVGLTYMARTLRIRLDTQHTGIIASLRKEQEIVGYSLCFYTTFAVISVMMLLARTTVLSRLGEVSVGHLQAAFSIALTVGAVLYPLSNIYLGPLVNSHGPVEEKARVADEYVSRMLLLLLVGALPAMLFPALLLRVLFSTAFIPVSAALWLFVLWQCIFQVMYVYMLLLIGLDDIVFAAVALISGCVVAIALSGPLTSQLGLRGVAIALATGMALAGVALTARLRVRHGATLSRRLLFRLSTVILIVAVTGYLFAGREEIGVVPLLLRGGVTLVAALLCWFMLDPVERNPRLWLAAIRPRSTDAVPPDPAPVAGGLPQTFGDA